MGTTVFTTVRPTRPQPAIALPKDLFCAIDELKRELKAVVLALYYQDPDIQDIAHFIAETAKILNPDKLVLLPDLEAGCSLADSCPPKEFAEFKEQHPPAIVVSYINCTADIKAMSDVICTSSNAVKIVNQLPKDRPIIFGPDRNLGRYVAQQTGRDLILWQGSCIVHETFSEKKIVQLKIEHPNAEIIAHPECEETVLRHAKYIGSTTALLKYSQQSSQGPM